MLIKPDYRDVIRHSQIMEKLAEFEVHLVGTPPLDIAVAESDLDFICYYSPDKLIKLDVIMASFQDYADWSWQMWASDAEVWICRFTLSAWQVEIFCSTTPVIQQAAFRHYEVERRLLGLANTNFKQQVIKLKQQGIKTEPAFASVLNITQEPYQALYALYDADDHYLQGLLEAQHFLKSTSAS